MKIPEMKDITLNPVPRRYQLTATNLQEIISQMGDNTSNADLMMIIYGVYRWGFIRGAKHQKAQEK